MDSILTDVNWVDSIDATKETLFMLGGICFF